MWELLYFLFLKIGKRANVIVSDLYELKIRINPLKTAAIYIKCKTWVITSQRTQYTYFKAVPLQAWRSRMFQEVEFPRFHDNGTGWW